MLTLNAWFAMDVKDAAQAWAHGAPNQGLILTYASGSSNIYEFSSQSVAGKQPALVVTYQ